jgi:hypothetical protein
LINCRADRVERSAQLAKACLYWKPADHYVVIGSATEVFARCAASQGLGRDRISCVENARAEQLFAELQQRSDRSALIVGMGNISGPGMEVVELFRRRSGTAPATMVELQEAA